MIIGTEVFWAGAFRCEAEWNLRKNRAGQWQSIEWQTRNVWHCISRASCSCHYTRYTMLQLQLLIVIDIVFQTKTEAHFLDVPNMVKVSKNEAQCVDRIADCEMRSRKKGRKEIGQTTYNPSPCTLTSRGWLALQPVEGRVTSVHTKISLASHRCCHCHCRCRCCCHQCRTAKPLNLWLPTGIERMRWRCSRITQVKVSHVL